MFIVEKNQSLLSHFSVMSLTGNNKPSVHPSTFFFLVFFSFLSTNNGMGWDGMGWESALRIESGVHGNVGMLLILAHLAF